MKSIRNLFFASIIIITWFSCAKQSSPMGGPKDEDPPILLETDPEDNSINVKPREINLIFNEYVALENPNKQIIITPRIKVDEVEFLAIKNRVNIKLNQELEDETTYVFNFQKSVQDITEKNPAESLKLVFSTGSTIDSISISGKIAYIFPQKEKLLKDILVGLYEENDTTDLFTSPPYYISQADTAGNFSITNIKSGIFRLYAWHDENNSLKAEYRNEAYGFYSEPIDISSDISDIHINLYKGDLSDLKINRSSPTGRNYDIVLSKSPISYEIIHEDIGTDMFYRLNDKTIRIYHNTIQNDSTEIQVVLRDSVGYSIDTTLYAKFEPSDRRDENLEISVNSGLAFLNNIRSEWTFNKPVNFINYDSLFITYDTAGVIPITPENIYFLDSSKRTKLIMELFVPDSLTYETYTIYAGDSSIRDIQGVYNNEPIKANYRKLKQDRLADGISGTVHTEERPILLQLINKKNEIVEQLYLEDTNTYQFSRIEAGDYRIRAIIDRNKNRKWDPGNYFENRQPEPLYFYYDTEKNTDEFILKGGWLLTDVDIFPRPDTGIYQSIEMLEQEEDLIEQEPDKIDDSVN
ncbi:Ig-like domain-containing domain [Lunatibacter salilacus]|uniref:Ig-like domain-containing domain n=1 Tax=Lunatibacter salilacus TaxID=2483804 RepID=UPI0021D2D114|nr:Ig-like domain-containing domain [Lunatibacter salilacus]